MKKYIKMFIFMYISTAAIYANSMDKNLELENKMNSVSSLLNRSTISNQVLHSNNEAAIQYYRFAKSLYDDASDAYDKSDIEKANELINKSRAALLDAVEFANLKGAKHKKRGKNNYDSLRKSANALMDALERISAEKDAQDKFRILSEDVNVKLSHSDKLYFQEQYDSAIVELSQVLQTIKIEISKQRSGDTLTKSLNFASDKEEYLYEIDRNDTHFMLLNMFLSENDKAAGLTSSMNDVIKVARSHRNEAEKLASNFKHKQAVTMLEKSTMEIINVIRNTGAFIP
ncbi:MAG: hypothetical protein OEY66_04945 [Gammaproteobacteria bacterium]|nr:hypothetical protein [Gammaproteobacteria bacterium]